MIITLDEHENVILTEQAMLIDVFYKLYESTTPSMVPAVFGVIYWMYSFDSKERRDIEDERDRIRAVKKKVPNGSSVSITREMRRAMDMFRDLYDEDKLSLYFTMHNNVMKLKSYADNMVLVKPEEGDTESVLVEYKEFTTINELLPKQEKLLADFEETLKGHAAQQLSIYGGGRLGAYE